MTWAVAVPKRRNTTDGHRDFLKPLLQARSMRAAPAGSFRRPCCVYAACCYFVCSRCNTSGDHRDFCTLRSSRWCGSFACALPPSVVRLLRVLILRHNTSGDHRDFYTPLLQVRVNWRLELGAS
jgi:hypothetical protein